MTRRLGDQERQWPTFIATETSWRFEIQILIIYTAQQKFSMDFIFVLILVRIRNEFLKI